MRIIRAMCGADPKPQTAPPKPSTTPDTRPAQPTPKPVERPGTSPLPAVPFKGPCRIDNP